MSIILPMLWLLNQNDQHPDDFPELKSKIHEISEGKRVFPVVSKIICLYVNDGQLDPYTLHMFLCMLELPYLRIIDF